MSRIFSGLSKIIKMNFRIYMFFFRTDGKSFAEFVLEEEKKHVYLALENFA
jgi:hypothetical protein